MHGLYSSCFMSLGTSEQHQNSTPRTPAMIEIWNFIQSNTRNWKLMRKIFNGFGTTKIDIQVSCEPVEKPCKICLPLLHPPISVKKYPLLSSKILPTQRSSWNIKYRNCINFTTKTYDEISNLLSTTQENSIRTSKTKRSATLWSCRQGS